MIKDEIILVLYEHRFFGWKYNVFSAEQTESGSMRILGAPSTTQQEEKGDDSHVIRLIELVAGMSDQSLMKLYSRKKNITDFHREITPDLLEKYIRPFIEKANHKITQIAREDKIPVFIRTDLSNNTLFVQNRLQVMPQCSTCLFHFTRNETELRYFVTVTNEGKEVELFGKRHIILSDKPSVVLIDKDIHCVDEIESIKLTPFFSKRYISVPPASQEMYIRNFVTKALLDYPVEIEGIPVHRISIKPSPILTLEEGFHEDFILLLSFEYNEDRFRTENRTHRIIRAKEENGVLTIEWYDRQLPWENQIKEYLLEIGLEQKGASHFVPSQQESPYGLIEWLGHHKEQLEKEFRLEQNLEVSYFLGNITKESSLEEKIDWFEVKIMVVAGEFRIPFSRFRRHILEGRKEYILPDKRVLILPDEWFTQYYDLVRYGKEKGNALEMKKVHAPIVVAALEGDLPQMMQQRLQEIIEIPTERPPLPKHNRATLRPYQKEGFYWLWHLYRHHFGACLADDMGLGKTLQTITLLQFIYENAPHNDESLQPTEQLSFFDTLRPSLPASLVVAPTSLLHNWKNELKRFAPELRVFLYTGANRLRSKEIGKIFNRFEVVVTSYGVMRKDIEFIRDYRFQAIILDESQYIKNPASLSYQSAKELQSEHRIVLTGTPIENSLEDLWAQFNFINEGLLGSFSSFRKEFIQKIIREKNTGREAALRRMIAPFMLRRTKEEVTPELPPLLQEVIYCDMTEEQQEVYQAEKNRVRNTLLKLKEESQPQTNTFIALEGLNRLRQLANHPSMIDPDYQGDSGKFEQILMFFENLKASGHKVLIFSSYVKHLNLLARKFDRKKWKYAMLTGETLHREEEIRRFTQQKDIHCFFISLKAGATGLNLTAADYVFIIDPWWNPAAEMQALSRAHRIGQEKPVIAYRFISTETVEEKILHLQAAKSALFETFVESQNPLSKLDWEEIEGLLNT